MKQEYISVELGGDYIKLAGTALAKGAREVVCLVKRPLSQREAGDAAEAKISREIADIFTSLEVPFRRVRLNIPRHLVTVRFLRLPSVDDGEIGKMVKIESLKHVPYADEDVVSGYRVIEHLPDGYSNVMIAVVQADTVRREADMLKKAGLIVESVSLGSEALLLWYLDRREAAGGAPALVVNIDADHIDIDVVAGNMLLFTRGVLYAAAKPISAQKIVEQVDLSIAAYRKDTGKSVTKVALSGVRSKVEELKALLAKGLKIPVEAIDQADGIPVRQGGILETADASFVELLGLALRPEGISINLLPETAREGQRLELVKKNIATSLVVSALIILMAFGIVLKKMHDKRAYISYIDAELEKIAPQVKKVKKMAKEIDLVTSKISERPLAIDLMSEVFKITPQGITLTMMEYESGKALTLRGTAPSLSDVFKYVTTLERSAYFKNVKVKYANKRISQASDMADFEMICSLSGVKK